MQRTLTMCPHRLEARTPPFHGGNRGSNPLGDATLFLSISPKPPSRCDLFFIA